MKKSKILTILITMTIVIPITIWVCYAIFVPTRELTKYEKCTIHVNFMLSNNPNGSLESLMDHCLDNIEL